MNQKLTLNNKGANLILACRDMNKAREACERIKSESQNENVQIELLDLGSLRSIREFSERIKTKFKRVDILLNNAGKSECYLNNLIM